MKEETITVMFHEHAVEVHDEDAAETVTVAVWLQVLDESPLGETEARAIRRAKKDFGWVFAGNTVNYEYEGVTGRIMQVDRTNKMISGYNENYSEESFYKSKT